MIAAIGEALVRGWLFRVVGAALLVAGGGIAAGCTSPSEVQNGTPAIPTSSPSASAAPILTSIPPEAMLQPEDLGAGHTIPTEFEEGDWRLAALSVFCDSHQPAQFPGPEPQVNDSKRRIIEGAQGVIQAVSLSSETKTDWEMDDVRRFVDDCASFQADWTYLVEIIPDGLAGPDSILVRTTFTDSDGKSWTNHHMFGRHRALLTEIAFGDHTPEQMNSIGQTALDRLKAAAGSAN